MMEECRDRQGQLPLYAFGSRKQAVADAFSVDLDLDATNQLQVEIEGLDDGQKSIVRLFPDECGKLTVVVRMNLL